MTTLATQSLVASKDDHAFWYCSEALPPFLWLGPASSSKTAASFSNSAKGFPPIFFGPGAFFCFFALGGVADRALSSCTELTSGAESSSSESGFGRFLEACFGFSDSVVCVAFLGATAFGAFGALGAFGAVAFAGALDLGFAFCKNVRTISSRSGV